MLGRHFIRCAGLTLLAAAASGIQTANAQTAGQTPACQSIDRVWESVTLVRGLDPSTSQTLTRSNKSDLERLLFQISSLTLGDISQSQSVSSYVERLRSTLNATSAERVEFAPLKQAVTQTFLRDVEALEAYWNCRTVDSSVETDSGLKDRAMSRGQSGVLDVASGEGVNPNAGMSDAKGLSPNSRVLKNSKVGRDIDFVLELPVLFLLFAAFMTGLAVYLQRRSTRFKSRQKRRILQTPIRARIGKTDYAMILVDISMNGGKVQHSGEIDKNKSITLEINGRWHSGKIIWSNDAFAGVSFKKPLKAPVFNDVVNAVLGGGVVA